MNFFKNCLCWKMYCDPFLIFPRLKKKKDGSQKNQKKFGQSAMQVHQCSQNTFDYHPHQPNVMAVVELCNAPYAAHCYDVKTEMDVGSTYWMLKSLVDGYNGYNCNGCV